MKKWIVRIGLGLLVVLGLFIAVIAGMIIWDSIFPAQQATDFTNITYPGEDGLALNAYLAKPQGAGPIPAVLMVHEF
jgi:hypothetical protein